MFPLLLASLQHHCDNNILSERIGSPAMLHGCHELRQLPLSLKKDRCGSSHGRVGHSSPAVLADFTLSGTVKLGVPVSFLLLWWSTLKKTSTKGRKVFFYLAHNISLWSTIVRKSPGRRLRQLVTLCPQSEAKRDECLKAHSACLLVLNPTFLLFKLQGASA